MTSSPYKLVIAGAASLRGKELGEALGESPFASADFVLLDDEEALGQLESVGDEVTFVQQITPASFERADFAFFTGDEALTRKHAQAALRAGASLVDVSGALEEKPGVVVCAPWLAQDSGSEARPLDLATHAIVPAHPAALALALLMQRLQRSGAIRSAFATVLEPASEFGRQALDELHQQTVNLLSFQKLPQAIFDAQVAFNLLPALGEGATLNLADVERRIRRHYAKLSQGKLPGLAIQLIQAPVFHAFTMSLGIEFETPVESSEVLDALRGDHVEIAQEDAEMPSNLSATGQESLLVRLRAAQDGEGPQRQFMLWSASDNLKLMALNAIACAQELQKLRPRGQVQ
jgi:aspartate-semialdehyde dehydrogenase